MNLDLRTARTIESPTIRSRRFIIGWECQRPFIAVRKYDEPETLDNGVVYVGEEYVVFIGGCRVWQGAGCYNECDGCLAYASAYMTDYTEADDDDEDGVLYEAAQQVADAVGHGPRCAMRDETGYLAPRD